MDVKKIREKEGLTQEEFSIKTGIPRGRINGWEQRGTKPKTEDHEKIIKAFNIETNVPRETEAASEMYNNSPSQDIRSLIESNKILAESDKIKAETSKKLVESTAALVGLLKHEMELKSIASKPEENLLTNSETIKKLVVLIAKVGSGKRWDSENEALGEISSILYGEVQKEKSKGISSNASKSNIS